MNIIILIFIITIIKSSSVGDLEVPPEVIAQLPVGYLPVSVKSGQNVVVLRENIESMLLDLESILQQRQEKKEAEADAEAEAVAAKGNS